MNQTSEFIGPRIRKLREANQLSREKLADVLSLSDSYIGLIERGTRGITINNLIKIGDYFDVPVEYFISNPSHSSNPDTNTRLLEISNHIKNLADEDYQCLIKIVEDFSTHYKKK